jgi:capsular polysaccharide transport system permease protein
LFEAGAKYNGLRGPSRYSVKTTAKWPTIAAAEKAVLPGAGAPDGRHPATLPRQARQRTRRLIRRQGRRDAMTLAEQRNRRYAPRSPESWLQADQSSSGKGADESAGPPDVTRASGVPHRSLIQNNKNRFAMVSIATRSALRIQRDVIYALLLRELSSRFGKSRGGFLWVLFEPIAHLLVPVMVFGFIRYRFVPGVEYPVFLVYGFLPFLLFKAICLQIVNGVNTSQRLLSYRQILLMDVFVAKALAHMVIQAIVFAVVLTGLALLGYDVLPARPVELAGVLVLTVALAFGLGLVFAAIASLVPDARQVINVMFMPLYFISGVLFPVTRFPDEYVRWMAINPVLHLVELSRVTALKGFVPMKYLSLSYPLTLALVTTLIGFMLYRLRYLNKVTM